MEPIKNLLPKAVVALEQQMKAGPAITQESEGSQNIPMLRAFEKFNTFGDPQLTHMRKTAIEFAQELHAHSTPRWLSLLGTSGAGKTMLARWINRVFKDSVNGCVISETRERIVRAGGGFISWARLANELREGNYRMFDDICEDYFVIVDDIGSEHKSDFIRSKLYELCSRRETKWTVFTANLSLEQIGLQIDPRIASRMIRHGSAVVDIDVMDFNLRRVAA